MGLGFTKPDPGVIDQLSLDAAWERAKQCEQELRQVRETLKVTHEQYKLLADRDQKLANGIWTVIGKHPEMEPEIRAELEALLQ